MKDMPNNVKNAIQENLVESKIPDNDRENNSVDNLQITENDSVENLQMTENVQAENTCEVTAKEAPEDAAEDTCEKTAEEAPEEVKRVPRKRNKLYMCFYAFTKRLFDFLSSLVVSILISPILLIVTIIMLFKSFGNPIYKQKRLGRKGKVLKIYKFRSMRKGADNLEKFLNAEQLEEYKREYKLKDDPRLIGYKKAGDGEKERCFGAKIRKTSIDELPQIFFNICILGNMSVVGPRPILTDELEKNYTEDEQKLLLSAKPGLTGYWQAYARNNATYKSGERQKMELYYAENRSLGLDIKIIFKTIISVLKKDGAE